MPERVVTPAQRNRAVLARQGLLERTPVPVPRMLERMAGLQAQYAPSMYVGLWSRVAGLERDAVTALLERRSIVQATLLRATIHLVSRRDHWAFALPVREARRRLWLVTRRGEVAEAEMVEAAALLRARLEADGPLWRKDVEALVGKARAQGVGLWVDLVRLPPSGTWERRRADLWGLAEVWVGPPDTTPEAGLETVVRRYLGGFGPAAPADVAQFLGLRVQDVAPVLERVATRRLRASDGTALVDLPRAPLPDPDTPAPVRFLPTWDAVLLTHCRGSCVLAEEDRPRIFSTRMPQSLPTFLVDGRVAGTWRHGEGRISLDPWRRLDAADRRALREEADRLAQFHADR